MTSSEAGAGARDHGRRPSSPSQAGLAADLHDRAARIRTEMGGADKIERAAQPGPADGAGAHRRAGRPRLVPGAGHVQPLEAARGPLRHARRRQDRRPGPPRRPAGRGVRRRHHGPPGLLLGGGQPQGGAARATSPCATAARSCTSGETGGARIPDILGAEGISRGRCPFPVLRRPQPPGARSPR